MQKYPNSLTWAYKILKSLVDISVFSTDNWPHTIALTEHLHLLFVRQLHWIQNSIYMVHFAQLFIHAVQWKTKMWQCHLKALIPPLEDWYNAEIWSLYHQPTFKWNLIHNQVSFKWIINLLQGSLSIRCRLCFHFLGRI